MNLEKAKSPTFIFKPVTNPCQRPLCCVKCQGITKFIRFQSRATRNVCGNNLMAICVLIFQSAPNWADFVCRSWDLRQKSWKQIKTEGRLRQRGSYVHTNSTKQGWWEAAVVVLQRWCQHWENRGQLLTHQIYGCYSSSVYIYVCVYSCWDSPRLKQASYTFSSSELHLSFSTEGLMSRLTSLHPPCFSHRMEGDKEEWRQLTLSAIIHFSSSWREKKPDMEWQKSNKAVRASRTCFCCRNVLDWLHPHRDLLSNHQQPSRNSSFHHDDDDGNDRVKTLSRSVQFIHL